MDFSKLQVTSAIIAAFVAAIVSLTVAIINRFTLISMHREKLRSDRELTEKKFEFDKDLAERRFQYERDLHDHKRRLELADDLLASFFQASAIVRLIRSPSSSHAEVTARLRSPDETEDQAHLLDTYFVPVARIGANREFISSLLSKRYRVRAVLGEAIDEAFQLIDTVLDRIYASAVTLNNMVRRGSPALERHGDVIERCEADIWETSSQDDIALTVNRAIEIARQVCAPILEGRNL